MHIVSSRFLEGLAVGFLFANLLFRSPFTIPKYWLFSLIVKLHLKLCGTGAARGLSFDGASGPLGVSAPSARPLAALGCSGLPAFPLITIWIGLMVSKSAQMRWSANPSMLQERPLRLYCWFWLHYTNCMYNLQDQNQGIHNTWALRKRFLQLLLNSVMAGIVFILILLQCF